MKTPHFINAVLLQGETNREYSLAPGVQPKGRHIPLPSLYFKQRSRGLLLIFRGLKRLMRLLVKAIYLFPALLVAKVILWTLDIQAGDLITLVFVILVVLFFGLLALLGLLFPLVGPRSKRKSNLKFDLEGADLDRGLAWMKLRRLKPTPAARLRALCSTRAPKKQKPIRLRGRLHLCTRDTLPDGLLLSESWVEQDQHIARLMAGRLFVLMEPDQPPVVIVAEIGCWLVGRRNHGPVSFELGEQARHRVQNWLQRKSGDLIPLEAFSEGQGLALLPGDEVEVIASRYEAVPDMDTLVLHGHKVILPEPDSAADSPYRSMSVQPGLLLRGHPSAPLIIRTL